MRDYGKVNSTFWSSSTIAKLSDDARLLSLYLMTCTHGTIAGVFRLPDGYIVEDLGERWPADRVAAAFVELAEKGFARRCTTSKWVWIVKHLEQNRPENPNQRKAAVKVVKTVPDDCTWRGDFLRQCGPALDLQPEPQPEPEGLAKGSPNGSETLKQPFPNQYQEQEQQQEQQQDIQGADAPLSPTQPATLGDSGNVLTLEPPVLGIPPCPVKRLVGLFAEKVPEMPRPRAELFADGSGGEAMRQRWKWVLTASRENGSRYATNASEALEWFGKFFDEVAGSDFLTGRNGRWKGCSLTWLMKRENFAKVVDGQYSRERQAA